MQKTSQLNFDINPEQPLIIVISGLSGAGKDTIVKSLKNREVSFRFCITATSRLPREGEEDGTHYFFYSKEEFEQKLAKGDFLEHALVYEQYKGVPKSQVDDALASGEDIIIRVDYQGAATIKGLYPHSVLIFVTPEDVDTWWKRLTDRGMDTPEQLEIRRQHAQVEIEAAHDYFDYSVVNPDGNIDQALNNIVSIIQAEHHRIRK